METWQKLLDQHQQVVKQMGPRLTPHLLSAYRERFKKAQPFERRDLDLKEVSELEEAVASGRELPGSYPMPTSGSLE